MLGQLALVLLHLAEQPLDHAVGPLDGRNVLDHLQQRHQGILLEAHAIQVGYTIDTRLYTPTARSCSARYGTEGCSQWWWPSSASAPGASWRTSMSSSYSLELNRIILNNIIYSLLFGL